jgi:hypothetical protein
LIASFPVRANFLDFSLLPYPADAQNPRQHDLIRVRRHCRNPIPSTCNNENAAAAMVLAAGLGLAEDDSGRLTQVLSILTVVQIRIEEQSCCGLHVCGATDMQIER